MATRRQSQLTIAYSPTWKTQSDWDSPLGNAELTKAFPATSRNYLDLDETIEDILDCTGEDLLFELLTGSFARLNIDFDFDPDVAAGLFAGAYGVAASPVAGSNEVQTETVTADGGTRTLTVQTGANTQTTIPLAWNAGASVIQAALEALSNVGAGDIAVANVGGVAQVQEETVVADGGTRTLEFDGETTAPIAWDANAATIQAALEALDNVDPGDIVVSGTGPYVYTMAQQYAIGAVPEITSDDSLLENGGGGAGSGTSTFNTTTPGVLGTFTYTFASAMGGQQVNMIVPNTFNLTNGTSTFAETTPGEGSEHAISRLTGYTLPLFTFYVGFRGSDKQPVIFKNVVVNNIRVRSASRERVSGSVELIGSAELNDAVGFSMPDCQDILPIRFGDCKMNLAGTDYIANNLGREFEYYFDNAVTPKFDGSGIYSTRHERADQRPSQFDFYVLGEPGDSTDQLVKMRQSFEVSLQLGPDGRCVICEAPQALVKYASTPIRFGGDPPESELAIMGRPRKISGDSTTPTNVTAFISQSVAMLTPA